MPPLLKKNQALLRVDNRAPVLIRSFSITIAFVLTIVSFGCSTFTNREIAYNTEPRPFDEFRTGELRNGPWRIVVPETWTLSSVDHKASGDAGSRTPLVVGGEGPTGVTYRVEELPPGTPSDPDVLFPLLEIEASADAEITRYLLDKNRPGFDPVPVLAISEHHRSTLVIVRPRGAFTDLISISGPPDLVGPDRVFGPSFLDASCRADYGTDQLRVRNIPPHLSDPTGRWRWVSDVNDGILVEGSVAGDQILIAVQRTDPRQYVSSSTATVTADRFTVWTGVRLYHVSPVESDPSAVDLVAVPTDNNTDPPVFRLTLQFPEEPSVITDTVGFFRDSPDLQRLVQHVLILDPEEAPR